MGTTLLVNGTLRGMGCEAECSLIATRSDNANPANAMFTRCAILEAPLWLPDGYYEATFIGQSAFLHRVNGVWSAGVPWRHGQALAVEPVERGRANAESAPGSIGAVTK